MTSLQALETAAVSPDAIVTATAHGSLEYSERLLTAMATGDALQADILHAEHTQYHWQYDCHSP